METNGDASDLNKLFRFQLMFNTEALCWDHSEIMDKTEHSFAAGSYVLKMICATSHLHPTAPNLPLPALKRRRGGGALICKVFNLTYLRITFNCKGLKCADKAAAAAERQIHPPDGGTEW